MLYTTSKNLYLCCCVDKRKKRYGTVKVILSILLKFSALGVKCKLLRWWLPVWFSTNTLSHSRYVFSSVNLASQETPGLFLCLIFFLESICTMFYNDFSILAMVRSWHRQAIGCLKPISYLTICHIFLLV